MDFVRKYLSQIKAQLNGLTVSQKLLIGLLTVVMLATIFFTVIYSAKPQMVALIAQPMTAEQISAVEIALKGKYDYQVVGDKVMVPAEQAYSIRGALAEQRALPKDLSTAFSQVAMNPNLFETDANSARKWNFAVQQELTNWLRGFSYVEDGSVIIAQGQQVSLGRQPMPSTATVQLKVKGNQPLTSSQVMAIAEMVAGATSGMKREDVRIVDGDHAYHVPSEDLPLATDYLEYKNHMEDYFSRKLYSMFDDIGNVKVAVNVVLDLSSRHRETASYDPKSTVVKAEQETSRNMTSSSGSAAGGEPGVTPNTSAVADTTASNKSGSTTNDITTKNVVGLGKTFETVNTPPGVEIKDITASLSIPRSYFLAIFRRQAHDPKADPDDSDPKFKAVMDDTVKMAQARAKTTIGTKTDDQIRVDWFDDTIASKNPESVPAGVFAAGSIPGMITQYARQGVLALVALGALGMMLMMVRRAVPGGDGGDLDPGVFFGGASGGGNRKGGAKSKRRGKDVDQLESEDDVFGEAGEGDAVLTGIELDDETLASRKMVDEVSNMVKENPENAAALVKRWMTKSK